MTNSLWKYELVNIKDTFRGLLLIILHFALVVWYVHYQWKRINLHLCTFKVNGPFPLPFIGNLLKFVGPTYETLRYITDMPKKYKSPVRVWMGQKLYFVVWKPHQFEIILNRTLEKGEYYKHTEVLIGTGLITASVDKWKRHKKIIMPTFNQRNLDNFVEIFSKQSEILVDQLRNAAGNGPIDIFGYVSRCTLDFICETAIDVKINAQTTDCEYMRLLNRFLELVFKKMICVWYHYDFIYKRLSVGKEFYDITKKLLAFTDKVITHRRTAYQHKIKNTKSFETETRKEETPRKSKTFLDLLIELSEEGVHFTDEELRDEVNTFIDAGSDTNATGTSFIFLVLGMFPEVQAKVYREVIDTVGPNRPIDYKDIGYLVYLERVIKEVMRVFPVIPTIERAVTDEIKLDSCTLPSGSFVFLNIMSLHRDPEVWSDPLEFNPDRYLSEEIPKRHPYSWLPFGGGPRNCVGLKYAMMSMKTVVAAVVRRYCISTAYKSVEDVLLEFNVTLKPVNGYKVSILERKTKND